jgi:hypothetical protein
MAKKIPKQKRCTSVAANYGQQCVKTAGHRGKHMAGPTTWDDRVPEDSLPPHEVQQHIDSLKKMLRQLNPRAKEALWKWFSEDPEVIDALVECVAPNED